MGPPLAIEIQSQLTIKKIICTLGNSQRSQPKSFAAGNDSPCIPFLLSPSTMDHETQ
jgi:hypothetical protein